MRFLESFVAAATVVLIQCANGTGSVNAGEYCKALTEDGGSSCNNQYLCTFSNGMRPKYSCSQNAIDEATRTYEDNVAGIRDNPKFAPLFPQYSDFLNNIKLDLPGTTFIGYFDENPGQIKVLKYILNIVMYIPNNIGWGLMVSGIPVGTPGNNEQESQFRGEVVDNINPTKEHAYESIAILDMIGVPNDVINYTWKENLMALTGLIEIYKYTSYSRHMLLSIEERLHLFALIKRFHEQVLTTDPRLPRLQLAIVDSLRYCMKPESVYAQNGYYETPVNFSAWSNVVNSIKSLIPAVLKIEREPLPLDIIKGLITGAGMKIPPSDDHHDVAPVRIKLSRFELLRASFQKLNDMYYIENRGRRTRHGQKSIMLFRLILANHFETIPNDLNHPIVYKKLIFIKTNQNQHMFRNTIISFPLRALPAKLFDYEVEQRRPSGLLI